MAKLYFDISDGVLFVDGKMPKDNTLTTPSNCTLAVSYMHSDVNAVPTLAKLVIKNDTLMPNSLMLITNCGMDTFIVQPKYRSISSLCTPDYYDEQQLECGDIVHIFQAYIQDKYYFCIQTQEEIFTQTTPNKLENIQLCVQNIDNVQLIIIKANCARKKYLCILEYSDDYYPLLDVVCDDICVYQDFITLTDRLYDMHDRTVRRYLSLCQGAYQVDKIEFDYPRRLECVDELLGYALVESYFCGDWDACYQLAPNFSNPMLTNILGKFESILPVDIVPYVPYRIGLVYGCESGKIVKYFDFRIQNHLIDNITLCK